MDFTPRAPHTHIAGTRHVPAQVTATRNDDTLRKRTLFFAFLGLLAGVFVAASIQPYSPQSDAEATLIEGAGQYPSELRRLKDGTYLVAVRTPMPGVTADMVRWWFSDFLQTTEQYKWWHPRDHIWMDWENKKPGEIYGASHLVHEYIGADLNKLRIQFVQPEAFFGRDPNDAETFVLCARVGELEIPIYFARMCHIVRNTPDGAEMRSRFWLGHVSARSRNDKVASPVNLIGNGWLTRHLIVSQTLATDLLRHAREEMAILATLLPPLYQAHQNAQSTFTATLMTAVKNSQANGQKKNNMQVRNEAER